MPETLAIQIEPDLIQLARARSGDGGAALIEMLEQELPQGADPMGEAAALLQKHKGSVARSAVTLDWRLYSIREQWLQLSSQADIASVIKMELADDLAAAPQSLVMPFQIVEERPEGTHVVAWSAAKSDVAALLGLMDSAGLSTDAMPPDAVGHIGLVSALAGQLVDQPIIAISGDSRGVNLSLMQGGLIWAHRRLARLNLAIEAAGQPLQEIRRLMLATPGFPAPQAVVSFGPETADTLARVLAGELNCQHVAVAPPPQAAPGRQGWSLVSGVALALAVQDELPLSFRQEEFEPKESVRMVGMMSAMALGLLGVCLAVGGFTLMVKAQGYESQRLREFENPAAQVWVKEVGGKAPMLSMFPGQLNNRTNELRKALDKARENQDEQPIYRYLVKALLAVPESVTYKIERISLKDDGALVVVTTDSDKITQLNNHLNQSRYFTSVLQSDAGAAGESRYTLNLTYRPQSQASRT